MTLVLKHLQMGQYSQNPQVNLRRPAVKKNIGLNLCLAEAQNIFLAVTKTNSVYDIISNCTRQLSVNINYPHLLLFTNKNIKDERE